ncbi:hypothetical protein DMB38_20050 [Streptomyces sp. WAC 06738]|uniref:hypothetical protein n=1 Tax=Streptomyces sp. WAC 06738 TaxID=2203210 RepID=UPI000F6EABAC|nr:hypothetical protein [Streptomyces sp. WAC 06738]AZM47771.1 hypothetical protein DMB38_20050 [Streptomyces sp. WAC 06738]
MTHWTPPNRGKTSTGGPVSTGQFPTMGDELHRVTWVRPEGGQSASRQGISKSGGGNYGRNTHRSHRQTSAAETYGPAGVVQVKRSLHGPGCACCATTGRRPVASAFGSQDQFRAGEATGRKG